MSYDLGWEKKWDDMKRYGPFSRHLRRLILEVLEPLAFQLVLDIGCGQGSLLNDLRSMRPTAKLHGVDISAKAIDMSRFRLSGGDFRVLDIERQVLDRTFDLVICSEVLEHINDDLSAIRHLVEMTGKYLLVTAPQGRMRRFEATEVFHVRNYRRGELATKLERNGVALSRTIEWGFPFYSPLYRSYLGLVSGKGTTGQFGPLRKCIASVLYQLFRLNSSKRGDEIIILAERAGTVSATNS